MPSVGLDPRLTFDAFVVGPANRLAHSAALRSAENLGALYNPLVLYGASGLGKTHLLVAFGNRVAKLHPQLGVVYTNMERLLEKAASAGQRGALRDQLRGVHLLLIDDAQVIAGRAETHEELLAGWDAMLARGGQIALASDRPPNDLQGLDPRLATRIAAGLIADLAPLEHETRLAIVARRAAERGQALAPGVADTLARIAFASVRELQDGLDRVLAAQELESRTVPADELPLLLGFVPDVVGAAGPGEFGSFLSEMSGTLDEVIERLSPEQRLAGAILRWEGEGFLTARLDAALARNASDEQAKQIVATFEDDVARLRAAEEAIRSMDAHAPELARADVLRDPDMVRQAEALAGRVRDRLSHRTAALGAQPNGDGAPATGFGAHAGSGARGNGGHAASTAATPPLFAVRTVHAEGIADRWFVSREKVLWDWPYLEDAIVTD